jgi:hypothetical protein
MWHLVTYDQMWTFLVKMEMGLVKWDILSIDTYSQIGQYVYTFSKKNKGVVNWDMEPNGTCTYNHKFWKRKYYI